MACPKSDRKKIFVLHDVTVYLAWVDMLQLMLLKDKPCHILWYWVIDL